MAKTLEYRPGDVTGPAVPLSPVLLMVAGGILYASARAGLARVPRLRNWLRHLAEMLVAMLAGMLLLGPVWHPLTHHRPTVATLVMALDMTAGMAAWMAVRGHGPKMTGEMAAAMVAPFVLLAPWIGGTALSTAGHALMLVAMVGLMLVRWEHYSATPAWVFRSRQGADVPPSTEPDRVPAPSGMS